MVRKKERDIVENVEEERVIYKNRNQKKQTKEAKSRSREDGASYTKKAAAKFCKLAHLTTPHTHTRLLHFLHRLNPASTCRHSSLDCGREGKGNYKPRQNPTFIFLTLGIRTTFFALTSNISYCYFLVFFLLLQTSPLR